MLRWVRKLFRQEEKEQQQRTDEREQLSLSLEERIAILKANADAKAFLTLLARLVRQMSDDAYWLRGRYSIGYVSSLFSPDGGWTLNKTKPGLDGYGQVVVHKLITYKGKTIEDQKVAPQYRQSGYVWRLHSADLKELKGAYLALLELKAEKERLKALEEANVERQVVELEIARLAQRQMPEGLKE